MNEVYRRLVWWPNGSCDPTRCWQHSSRGCCQHPSRSKGQSASRPPQNQLQSCRTSHRNGRNNGRQWVSAGIPNIPPGVASALGKMQAVPGAPPLPGSWDGPDWNMNKKNCMSWIECRFKCLKHVQRLRKFGFVPFSPEDMFPSNQRLKDPTWQVSHLV